MYFNMALKNVKKSFKDYAIYFLTLSLAVCIFYSFNSINSQKAILEMKNSDGKFFNALVTIISYMSVFVSIILGSLILYANNFLIKRRNREFGIYMTLGMGKRKISKILFFETLIAAFLALIFGLLIGIIVSQGLSLLVLNLFKVNMDMYTFIFSISAVVKTVLYFSIIFFIVMIFNTLLISKYKIIDLLNMGRKNENMKFNKPVIYIGAFILSIFSLYNSYKMAFIEHLNVQDKRFLVLIILGVIGTVLFFYSISGFSLYILERKKKIYFKGLNIFVIKQISSSIKTNILSISLISIMLFVTITSLSTAVSIKGAAEEDLEKTIPYDASFYVYVDNNNNKSIQNIINVKNITNDLGEEYVFINKYISDVNMENYIDDKGSIIFIKESEYDKCRKLMGEEVLNLEDNEVYIISGDGKIKEKINKYIKYNNKISIKDKEYKIRNNKVYSKNIVTDISVDNIFTIVINDEFCDNEKLIESCVNIKYPEDKKEECEKKYLDIAKSYEPLGENYKSEDSITGYTKEDLYKYSIQISGIIILVLIYLGLVFLITSMAVLALKELTGVNDSMERYTALKRMGCSEKTITKTIFKQIFVFFSLPVMLSLVHSAVGIKSVKNFTSIFNADNLVPSTLVTLIIFMAVYIGYFLVTFTGCKNIIKSKI